MGLSDYLENQSDGASNITALIGGCLGRWDSSVPEFQIVCELKMWLTLALVT